MRRRANNCPNPVDREVRCLLFEEYLKFVLRGMQNHGVTLIITALLSVGCVAVPLRKWLIPFITRGRIGRFMEID